MSAEAVTRYIEAAKEFKRATAEADELMAFLSQSTGLLKEWRKVCMSNPPPDSYFGDLPVGRGPSIDAQRWPDAKRLAAVLSKWHWANRKVREAWHSIPAEDRDVFTPPV